MRASDEARGAERACVVRMPVVNVRVMDMGFDHPSWSKAGVGHTDQQQGRQVGQGHAGTKKQRSGICRRSDMAGAGGNPVSITGPSVARASWHALPG